MSHNNNISEEYIKRIQRSQKQMIEAFKPLLTQLEKTNIIINQVFVGINYQIFDSFTSAINSIDWKSIKRVYEGIREYAEVVNKFSLIMIEMDWPPPLNISPTVRRNIVERYEESSLTNKIELKQFVDDTILNCYSEEVLKDMLGTWSEKKWLKKRFNILEEVVDAHTERRFILSIPAMLPQIEGIIADGFGHKGRLSGRDFGHYIKNLLERGLSIDDCVDHFVFSVVLVKFEFGKPVNSSLSRHAIMHGADTGYATPYNSLKSIILFDYIQGVFEYALINGSEIYHAIDCFILENSKKPRQIFRNTSILDKLGKSPCKRCLK